MEDVWSFPRPPAVEPCGRRVRVVVGDTVVADSVRALRVLETSHPPTIYVPPQDVRLDALADAGRGQSFCEFKGHATYLDVVAADGTRAPGAAWTYRSPVARYAVLRDHVSFYPGRVGEAWLDDERVRAQEGDFYGGWITAGVAGPFKGPPGTAGW